jgi:hypothetical protein
MRTHVCPKTAIQAAVELLGAVMPAGAVIAVVVELPGHRDYRVGSPPHQNPALTYGMLREVAAQRSNELPSIIS